MAIPQVPKTLKAPTGGYWYKLYNYLVALVAAISTGWSQGGNAFGAQGVLGTTDANGILFKAAGNGFLTVDTSGNTSIGTTVANANTTISAPAATVGGATGCLFLLAGGLTPSPAVSRNFLFLDAPNSVNIGTGSALSVSIGRTGQNLGFLGTAAVAKQTVTGSKGGNVALANLVTALANLGLITDGTT